MSPAYGVYPVADALDVGDEISSTYEGRHITLLESDLVHPTHADGFVDKADPVVSATGKPDIVGVALKSAAAATDKIAIDTEGIWNLDVVAANDAGNVAVAGGDVIYINTTTAVLSKISNQATQVVFGVALGIIDSGSTEAIAVKVHRDPSLDNAKRTYYTVTSGAYTYGKHHTSVFAGGQSTGLEYFDQAVTGTQTGPLYGMGTWMELAAGYTTIASITVCFEVGLYDAGATLTLGTVIGMQMQIQVASQPANFYLFRVNGTNGYPIDAMFVVGNPDSLGWVAGAETATYSGSIPFYSWGGTVGWIRLYDGSS